MLVPLASLEESIGMRTPQENLVTALRAIFAFYERVVPMLCSLFADPQLLTAYCESLPTRNKDPHGAIARLHQYISPEQRLGRIRSSIHAETAATLLWQPRSSSLRLEVLRRAKALGRRLRETRSRHNLWRVEISLLNRGDAAKKRDSGIRIDDYAAS